MTPSLADKTMRVTDEWNQGITMPTYKQIQECVQRQTGRTVKTCWIAEAKRELGFQMRKAPNRGQGIGAPPCPSHYKEAIRHCIEHLRH